jgi:hypothetical protein
MSPTCIWRGATFLPRFIDSFITHIARRLKLQKRVEWAQVFFRNAGKGKGSFSSGFEKELRLPTKTVQSSLPPT